AHRPEGFSRLCAVQRLAGRCKPRVVRLSQRKLRQLCGDGCHIRLSRPAVVHAGGLTLSLILRWKHGTALGARYRRPLAAERSVVLDRRAWGLTLSTNEAHALRLWKRGGRLAAPAVECGSDARRERRRRTPEPWQPCAPPLDGV